MPDNSFDVVSQIEMPEVANAVQQAAKEVGARFDLKDSRSKIELNEKESKLTLTSADEYTLKSVIDILQQKLIKRKVPIKNLSYGAVQPAASQTVRQEIKLQSGIPTEKCKDIVKVIKDSKKKVQATIQGDLVRVASKDRDTLQEVIQLLRGQDFGLDLQFVNFRSN